MFTKACCICNRNRSCYVCTKRKLAAKQDRDPARVSAYTSSDLLARRRVTPATALQDVYDSIVTENPDSIMRLNIQALREKTWEFVMHGGQRKLWFRAEDEKYEKENNIQVLIEKFSIPMSWSKFRAVAKVKGVVRRLFNDEVIVLSINLFYTFVGLIHKLY